MLLALILEFANSKCRHITLTLSNCMLIIVLLMMHAPSNTNTNLRAMKIGRKHSHKQCDTHNPNMHLAYNHWMESCTFICFYFVVHYNNRFRNRRGHTHTHSCNVTHFTFHIPLC